MESRELNVLIAAEAIAAHEGGPPVAVATVIEAPPGAEALVGAKLLVRADGSTAGAIGEARLAAAIVAQARDALRRGGVETVYLTPEGRRVSRTDSGDAVSVMLEVHQRPARLLIVGGGHVGKALATIGHLCGFTIEVIDDRPEFANADRFPEAERITCGRFEEVLRDYPVDSSTHAVCVTRGHKHDETSLRLLAASPAAYVGMIGSKRRVAAVLQHIVEDGVDADAVARVHTPIGLDIGAETPEEIAVAIMAEIILTRRGGTAVRMRRTQTRPQ